MRRFKWNDSYMVLAVALALVGICGALACGSDTVDVAALQAHCGEVVTADSCVEDPLCVWKAESCDLACPQQGTCSCYGGCFADVTCQQLHARYEEVVAQARRCNPLARNIQCTASVIVDLISGCVVAANGGIPDAYDELAGIRSLWATHNCAAEVLRAPAESCVGGRGVPVDEAPLAGGICEPLSDAQDVGICQ